MLYINGRFLTQPMTGVERYAYNICKAMARLHRPFTIVCPKAPIHQDYEVSDLNIVHYGIGGSHFWEQWQEGLSRGQLHRLRLCADTA